MAELSTAIAEIAERRQTHSRELEEYLLALWGLASEKEGKAMLELQDVFQLLEGAFEASAIAYNSVWADLYSGIRTPSGGYAGWEEAMMKQVVELHEMREAGLVDNELRYHRLEWLRGAEWHNCRPCSYLDRARAGFISSWQERELTGRASLIEPGAVGAPNEDGMVTIELKKPKAIEKPMDVITALSWDDFRFFLWCGQHVE